jgi:hypothetical protein
MGTNRDSIQALLEDTAYLIDETEALGYVIETVPVYEKPTGSHSILEMIALIDYAQSFYFKPIVERLFTEAKPNISVDDFRKSFDSDKYSSEKISDVLKKMGKNRAALVIYLKKLPESSFYEKGIVNGKEQTIAGIINDMVKFERNQLRLVAERVLAIDNAQKKS